MARRATAIRQVRESSHEPVILLDGGDSLFRGGEWATIPDPNQGALFVETMNAMGYEAIALGERELYAPFSTVQARLREVQFPILSANVDATGVLSNVQPYLLRQAGEHTVAIVGVTSNVATKRLEALGLDLTVQDPVAAVGAAIAAADDAAVAETGKPADVVILLSNLDRSSTEAVAQAVPGIDAIVGLYDGEQREPVALPGAEGQVILHASAAQGQYLGVLTLQFDERGQVVSYAGRLLALTDRYADDPQIVEIFHRYASQQ